MNLKFENKDYIAAARLAVEIGVDGVFVPDDAMITNNLPGIGVTGGGAWVQAWLWVNDYELDDRSVAGEHGNLRAVMDDDDPADELDIARQRKLAKDWLP